MVNFWNALQRYDRQRKAAHANTIIPGAFSCHVCYIFTIILKSTYNFQNPPKSAFLSGFLALKLQENIIDTYFLIISTVTLELPQGLSTYCPHARIDFTLYS